MEKNFSILERKKRLQKDFLLFDWREFVNIFLKYWKTKEVVNILYHCVLFYACMCLKCSVDERNSKDIQTKNTHMDNNCNCSI